MARALSTAILTALSDVSTVVAGRRACSTAAPSTCSAVKAAAERMLKRESSYSASAAATGSSSEAACSWVPDPVTGYYRPADRLNEVDAAELRAMLLKRRS